MNAVPLAEVLQRAAQAWQRFVGGEAVDRALTAAISDQPTLRPAVLDVTMSAVRQRALVEAVVARLAPRSPPAPVAALAAVALAQLNRARHADFTVVDQAVSATRQAGQPQAAGFVNALLRNFLRQRLSLVAELMQQPTIRFNAPDWWLQRLAASYPDAWQRIAATAVEAPPMVLRVNRRRATVEQILQRYDAAGMPAQRVGDQALWLRQPRPVMDIPGFAAGEVSVQDAGAQLAASWLGVTDGMRVLDACAAPGGKTAHLAELAELDLTAVEMDRSRAQRIEENLSRVGGTGQVIVADAGQPAHWWDGRPFDRVLVDAPCTASGIVRRHPDIPWLRRPTDVAHLATVQAQLLEALWPLLTTGGRLLYVVCSVFPEESVGQITRFLTRTPDARAVPLPSGALTVQLMPTPLAAPTWELGSPLPTLHDGFFYAMCEKI